METRGIEDRRVLTVVWKIENIERIESCVPWWEVRSPIFVARTLEEEQFQFYLWPQRTETGQDLRLSLQQVCDGFNFPVDCEWSFIGCNGSPLASGTIRNRILHEFEGIVMSGCPTPEEVFVTRKSVFLPHDTLTVRFRIWSSEGDLSDNEFVSLRTRWDATNHSFLWSVPGLSTFLLHEEVTTPVKHDDGSDNFLLKFSFRGVSLENADADVELTRSLKPNHLVVKFKVSVLDNDRKVMKMMETDFNNVFDYNRENFILSKLISREELLRVGCDNMRNDVVTLQCEISTVSYTSVIEESYYGCLNLKSDNTKESITFLDVSGQTSENKDDISDSSLQRRDALGVLGEDLLNLYKEQSMTDFELRSGDVTFPVHKNILSARSPVFKAMFSSDMKESLSQYQDVPDVDVHTLNRLLTFLYGDTVEPDLHLDGAAKLYYAADKYQIQALKQRCSLIMRSSIQVSNVSDILTLADRHQDTELACFVDGFFLDHFDEIMQDEDWETFQQRDPALAMKTVHRVYKRKLLA